MHGLKWASTKRVDKILQYFSDKFPWIIVGFDEGIKEKWDSNPEELLEYVSSRKTEYSDVTL